jgi:hypothetical protein
MVVTHEDDLALLLQHQGETRLRIMRMTIILTIQVVAPDQVDTGYKKVIRILADQLREASTKH